MDRKNFLRKTLLGGVAFISAPFVIRSAAHENQIDPKKIVGHNHLPHKEIKNMNTIIHKAGTRGHADHGWLKTWHTFSFADYYNPERIHFGVLRVLNDDIIAAGKGFGTHPHDNMEIITIPLEGDLEHKDSMGNTSVIRSGEIQVMSAGTGIYHSEYNANDDSFVKLLQIWVFPDKKNVKPRYDQIKLDETKIKNRFLQILSPYPDDEGVWIHQNAWFHLGDFDKKTSELYKLKDNSNGLYVFIIEGEANIEGNLLSKRDGIGIPQAEEVQFDISENSRILLMEIPMSL